MNAAEHGRRALDFLATIWLDIRYGSRSLFRDPGFTLTAVLSLTLGVGLITAFFTIFNGILLRPWPLPDPYAVVTATHGISPAAYRHLRDTTRTVDLVAIAQSCSTRIENDVTRTNVRCVSGNYFDVLGVPLTRGRGFRADEDVPGAPAQVAVIGHRLWQDRFASSADAIGRTITVNRLPFEIVGIAAPGARDRPQPGLPQLWVPLAAYPLIMTDREFTRGFLFNPDYCCVEIAGRLRDGASRIAASAELTSSFRQFRGGDDHRPPITLTGTSEISQPWQASGVPVLGLMLAATVLVLVVACANAGNLQLARGARRRGELLVRLSLGASRARIVRQLLTEGMLLAVLAAAVSLGFAVVLSALLTRWFAARLAAPFGVDVSPDWRVVVFALAVSVVAVLATGLGPALRGTRRLVVSGRQADVPIRARSWFLAIQVALGAVLILGASLIGRALFHAGSIDPGFDADGVARIVVQVPPDANESTRRAVIADALRGARTASGARLAAEAGAGGLVSVTFGQATSLDQVRVRRVSADYLRLIEVPVLEGRALRDDDSPEGVVVNETFARRAWPGRSAVGAVFVVDSGGSSADAGRRTTPGARRVVGVIGDMRPPNPNDAVLPTVFEPGAGDAFYVPNELSALERVRAVVRAADAAAIVDFRPLSADFERGLDGVRLAVVFAWALAFGALALAATGMFGVFALVAEERRREVGIRIALGAESPAIVRLMLRHAGRATAVGLALGFVGAAVAAPLLRSYLAGVGPYDPLAFAAAAIVLVATGVAATWMPIRRALRVDPAVALRAE
jgi:predicted permease